MRQANSNYKHIRTVCPEARGCLIKYFFAVGLSKKLSKEQISAYGHCPALKDEDLFKKDIKNFRLKKRKEISK